MHARNSLHDPGGMRGARFAQRRPRDDVNRRGRICPGLRFANGAYGALMATTAEYPGFPERIELIGAKGTAILTAGVVTVRYHDGREERVGEEQGTGGGADPMAFPHDAHRALLADFLDAIDQDRSPRVSGREALRVHHLIDAVLRSSAEHRAVAVETL